MYSSNNNNGPQNNGELDAIQTQINQRTNESLESTRRMVNLTAESQEIGTNTMVMLDEQGERLKQIEIGLDNVHAGMDDAEKNLTNLSKCCGLCVLPWHRVRRSHRPFTNGSTSSNSGTSSPNLQEPKQRMAGETGMPSKGFVTKITNDDREEEMDDNLQLVSSYLGNLKNMALDMGDTIESQNQRIGRITDKSDAGINRVHAANKQTQDLIRRA